MKIICVGRNYGLHAQELGNKPPTEPIIFCKPDTAILKNNLPFYLPEHLGEIHHEVELVVRINKVGKGIHKKFAYKYYNEITVGIDFTARTLQQKLKEQGLPWELAKAFDGSAVIGEFVPIAHETLPNTTFSLEKNGNVVQIGNVKDMLFAIDDIISYVSRYFTLKIGDLIFTGTPQGVSSIAIGDILVGKLEDKILFTCNVK